LKNGGAGIRFGSTITGVTPPKKSTEHTRAMKEKGKGKHRSVKAVHGSPNSRIWKQDRVNLTGVTNKTESRGEEKTG